MVTSLYGEMQSLMEKILDERYADQEKEKELSLELLQIAERENSLYCTAFAHTFLGDYYTSQNNVEDGGKHLEKAERLSKENGFNDLLPRVFNLHAICFEFLGDEMSAVQYYLRALQVVKDTENNYQKAILMNNVASILGGLNDFLIAKTYYIKACELFATIEDKNNDLSYVKLRVWSNLARTYGKLGELEEMNEYLTKCEAIEGEIGVVKKYTIYNGWCLYYGYINDRAQAEHYAQLLLSQANEADLADKIVIYEMLTSICEVMIQFKSEEISEKLLSTIYSLLEGTAPDRLLYAQKLKVKYCEIFGTEKDKNEAYAEFFHNSNMLEDSVFVVKSRSIKYLIYLDELQSNLELATKQLSLEAHLDELTQLYNRRYFNKLISKAYTSSDTNQIGFIVMDIDYFKEYNDTYGHLSGDCVLKNVAKILMQFANDNITPSRYGGDEFMMICINVNTEQISTYIEDVFIALSNLNIEHTESKCSDRVTLSVGFAMCNISENKSAEELTDKADLQLYRSKSAGRNTYRYEGLAD